MGPGTPGQCFHGSFIQQQERTEESINAAVIPRPEWLCFIAWKLCASSFNVTEKGSPVWFRRSFWPSCPQELYLCCWLMLLLRRC